METVAEMTTQEFQEMLEDVVEATVERKLLELLGDPDEGLSVRESFQARLRRQHAQVREGERGIVLSDVVQKLNLG
ncbi:MAG: hypothetical protein ACP5J4_04680 [Anaerolineae bacterium]